MFAAARANEENVQRFHGAGLVEDGRAA
jgi:hypothetical protein